MTKDQFVSALDGYGAFSELTKARKENIYMALFYQTGLISTCLKNGKEVRLGELGVLKVKPTAARKGRNPATGEEVHIPASRKVTFQPSKTLKDIVRP